MRSEQFAYFFNKKYNVFFFIYSTVYMKDINIKNITYLYFD